MRYLCLVYVEEKKVRALSRREYEALVADALAYEDELRRGGHYLASDALQPVESATTLRNRSGRVSITDGPFAETKEQLAGFYLIDAADQDQALKIAAQIPPAREGSIEVRPVRELQLN